MAMPSPMTWVWERFRNSFRGLHIDRHHAQDHDDFYDEDTGLVRNESSVKTKNSCLNLSLRICVYTYIGWLLKLDLI